MIVALIIAQAADALTFALMPRVFEANPLVAGMPLPLALAGKALLVAFVLWVATLQRPRVRSGLLLTAIFFGAFGAGSNVSVLLALWRAS